MATTQYLVSRVRLALGELSTDKLQDEMIYELATEVQNTIYARVRPEKKFTITIHAGTGSYYIGDTNTFEVKNTFTSWSGSLTFVASSVWEQYRNSYLSSQFTQNSQSMDYPTWATIFSGSVYLSPCPPISGSMQTGSIEFWCHQIGSDTPINAASNPSLPSYLHTALIKGVIAELDASTLPLYEKALGEVAMIPHQKTHTNTVEATW